MVIALVWNNAKSFKQHLEQMRMFRQSHQSNLKGRFTPLKNMPTSCDIHPPSQTGGASGFISVRGKLVIVPIWEIVLPRNSQN
jgi:hypothetical protein